MHKTLLTAALSLSTCMFLPPEAMAHGGQYRGPGDIVPPGGIGGGRSGRPNAPRGPKGPNGPKTGGPGMPSAGPPGGVTGGLGGRGRGGGHPVSGGISLSDDLTTWDFWWEFNKDPYIRLKAAIHSGGVVSGGDVVWLGHRTQSEASDTLRPTKKEILRSILPKLKQAMDETNNRDINSSCIIAMAKIGEDHPEFEILPVFIEKLKAKDQEISETAAVAMGISQMADAVDPLAEIVRDSAAGRALSGGSEVNDRTRSFAAYGLGLIGWSTNDASIKRQALDALTAVLKDDSIADRNVRVAAIHGIGLLRPDVAGAENTLLADCLAALDSYWSKQFGPGEQWIQSHVPTAVAKLLPADHHLTIKYRDRYLAALQGRSHIRNKQDNIDRSLVLALGQLTQADQPGAHAVTLALSQVTHQHKDRQTKFFALVSLGLIGDDMRGTDRKNRDQLLRTMRKAQPLEQSWAALGLGVMTHNLLENAAKNTSTLSVAKSESDLIGKEIMEQLKQEKNPDVVGAFAVALGLARHTPSADSLRELLQKRKNQSSVAGYLCIGLALMGDTHAKQDIQALVNTSVRRPELLKQAAIALGKLGDKSVGDQLQKLLTDDEDSPSLSKLSAVASALGFIGDRRTIQPLVTMLFNQELTDLARAFAAVALGGIADKEPLPWNSKIGTGVNYRAAVETLTNGASGILDIL